MDAKSKAVILAAIVLVLAIGLYPPWTLSSPSGRYSESAYGWIFAPPQDPTGWQDKQGSSGWNSRIDLARLMVQWAMVAIAASGVALTLKRNT